MSAVNFDVIRATVEASGATWSAWVRKERGLPYFYAEVVERTRAVRFVGMSDKGPGAALRDAWHKLQNFNMGG